MIVADAGGLPTGVVSGRIRLIELISIVLVPARIQQRHAEWTLASALRETLLLIAELLKEMNLPKLHFDFFKVLPSSKDCHSLNGIQFASFQNGATF